MLCGQEIESINHLFFNCSYTRKLLLQLTEYLNYALWKISNSPTPAHPDIRIWDVTEACQKFAHQAPHEVFIGIQLVVLLGTYGLKETKGCVNILSDLLKSYFGRSSKTPVYLSELISLRKIVVHKWKGLCRLGRQTSWGIVLSYLITRNDSHVGEGRWMMWIPHYLSTCIFIFAFICNFRTLHFIILIRIFSICKKKLGSGPS